MERVFRFLIRLLAVILTILALPKSLAFSILLIGWALSHHQSKDGFLRPIASLLIMTFLTLEGAVLFTTLEPVPPIQGNEVILIPGAAISGDQPQDYLRHRLDAALPVLRQYPTMKVIVSGGRSKGEAYSESAVMKKYLMDQGILEHRIMEEDQAKDTVQNFSYGKQVIKENNLPEDVIISTNEFHAFRCKALAKVQNLRPKLLQSATQKHEDDLLREVASLLKVYAFYGISIP